MIRERKKLRLKDYDYSKNGYYFVTTCVKNHECFFGEIKNDEMMLNEYGEIIDFCWNDLINHYHNCKLDNYIIMPNHLHGIIIIDNNIVGNDLFAIKKHGLPEIIRGFKTFSSKNINKLNKITFQWQKSYYDRIIRDNEELIRIREYIIYNPIKWNIDDDNPVNIKKGNRR